MRAHHSASRGAGSLSAFRFPFVILVVLFGSVAILVSFLYHSSQAHLALIRQHPIESAGYPAPGNRYGEASCAGDFNGDGFDDLCVGVPYQDTGIQNNDWEGLVVVHRGSPFGITHIGAVGFGLLNTGGDPYIEFGKSVAAGNFNGDAYDDLAVGAPFFDVGGNADAGAVYVYMGSATGIDPNAPEQWTQEDLSGFSQTGDFFGWSLVTGDFNADGVDDLAIGAIGELNEAGAVYVAYGVQGSGLSGANADIFLQSSLGDSDGAGEWFGYSLAAGSMVDDPQTDDLAIGAPYDRQSDPALRGRVYVVRGLVNAGLTNSNAQSWEPDSLGFSSQHNEGFGWSLAVGQFWGTNHAYQQLAVGAPFHDDNGQADAGRVIVLRPGIADPAVELFQDTPGDATVDAGDFFGWAVVSALLDGVTDDLLVGAPHEEGLYMGIPVDNGMVTRFGSSIAGPFPVLAESFNMDAVYLFDQNDRHLEMGYSFCVGQFDQYGKDNVVIGSPKAAYLTWIKPAPVPAPEAAAEAGQVHVYAPHRQVFNTRARSATAHDCNDNLVFSIRAWDPLQIASTTKAMTVWIASDHIEWGLIDSMDTYTLDDPYIPDCVSGSQADLLENETLTLADLMQLAVSESANDACYAIGDMITGGTWNWPNECGKLGQQLSAFVDTMNQRALDVGMPYTTFTNPAGRPMANSSNVYPHSTAYGMSRLGREALKNTYFRRLVRRTDWTITSNINSVPDGSNGWLKTMKGKVTGMEVNGIKPGWNDPSLNTRVVSGRGDGQSNEVIATVFGVEGGGVANNVVAELCTLAVSLCPEPTPADLDVLPDADFQTLMDVDSIPSSAPPKPPKFIAELAPLEGHETFVIDLARQEQVTTFASSDLSVNISVEFVLAPGEMISIGAEPFQSQDGIHLFNREESAADLMISHNQPTGTSFSLFLPPDEDSLIVGPTAMPVTGFTLSITNISSTDTAFISIDELGYGYTLTLGDGIVAPKAFSASFTHTGDARYGNLVTRVTGNDTTPGNTLRLVVWDPDVLTGIAGGDSGGSGDTGGTGRTPALVSELSTYPNPFNPSTTIAYELRRAAAVRLDIYDVTGRPVRQLENTLLKAAGSYHMTWDSRNERGSRVASGVYFVRLRVGTEVRMSRVVLLK